MTDAPPHSRRTVTLHASSGKPVLTVPLVPAAAVAAVALALAPRITALAALASLVKKMSLSIEAAPKSEAAV